MVDVMFMADQGKAQNAAGPEAKKGREKLVSAGPCTGANAATFMAGEAIQGPKHLRACSDRWPISKGARQASSARSYANH